MNLKRITSFLAASAILMSGSALAIDKQNILASINGTVLVNQGENYITADEGMHLFPGDQLMVMEDGFASIEFADGCLYKVNANEILRIDSQSACAVNASKAVGPYYTQLGSTTPTGLAVPVGTTGFLVFTAACAGTGCLGHKTPETISP